jgi:BirA family biotin operon repressor/biotin-[acetyl-CoA-carboxylase] ligase
MIIGSNLIFRETLTSTNTEASLLLRRGDVAEGTVIHTDFQTAGRGQPGNAWESESGKNLLISIILFPQSVKPGEQFLISMTISLGVCDFIDRHTAGCKVKWPNDIYVKDDKIAGILIENSIMGDITESAVAGIGLNINQEIFPERIKNPVSLKLLTGKELNTGNCLTDLLSALDIRYKQLLYGDRKKIHDEYKTRLYRFDELYEYRSGGKFIKGRISDVSVSGILTIKDEHGTTHRFSFKEVDFMI